MERIPGNREENPVGISLRSTGSIALGLAQGALGLIVGWEIGILPLSYSLGWILLSLPAVVLLAALGVGVRFLRPFLWTTAAIGL